jgi:hypothetical protein
MVWIATAACSFKRGSNGITDDALKIDGPVTGDGDDAPPMIDAPPDAPVGALCDPGRCGGIGGQCNVSGQCIVDENGAGPVVCPEDHFCVVTCDGGACANGVDCSQGRECIVACTGQDACREGAVKCPESGPCNVTCDGQSACQHAPVTCGTGLCIVKCLGQDACGDHGIECRTSQDCRAECRGQAACRNGGIDCGPGLCTAICDGEDACQNVSCTGTPTTCTYNCCEAGACTNGSLCAGCTRGNTCN